MIKEIKDNHLYWDGCDTVELAKNYGTPLYMLSHKQRLKRNVALYRNNL